MNVALQSTITHDLPVWMGENIRKIRQQQSISCNKLAKLVGVSTSFISKIERGERLRVNFSIIKKIADVLGLNLDLIGEEGGAGMTSAEKQRYRILQLLEKIIVSDELTHDETIQQLELVLEISNKVLND